MHKFGPNTTFSQICSKPNCNFLDYDIHCTMKNRAFCETASTDTQIWMDSYDFTGPQKKGNSKLP